MGWGRDDGVLQLTKAGWLVGLKNIKRGKQIDFMPYIAGGVEKEPHKDIDDRVKYGIDVKYPITTDLTLDLTTKTDFAQVESDLEQINLTRFGLQYPEKRDFFLEGSSVFSFSNNSAQLYYSRRIGITPDPDRELVPILGGVKLTGKVKSYRIGIMSMQTEEASVYTSDSNSGSTKNYYPSTNYTVVRVTKDVLQQSYLGFYYDKCLSG